MGLTPFETAWTNTKGKEGIYGHDSADPGGATKYGVTEDVARFHGYTRPMTDLTLSEAKEIARREYWGPLKLDDVAIHSVALSTKMFDAAYNCGPMNAAKWLQIALNAFNRNGTDYADLEPDGVIGKRTLIALARFLSLRKNEGLHVIIKAIDSQQGAYYISISQHNKKLERFTFGWFLNRIG